MDELIVIPAGQRVGDLVVIGQAKSTRRGNARYTCRCECRALVTVRASKLRNGTVTSCIKCASKRSGATNRAVNEGRNA